MNVFVGEAYSKKALWVLKVDTRECLITPTLPGGKSFNQSIIKKSHDDICHHYNNVSSTFFVFPKEKNHINAP